MHPETSNIEQTRDSRSASGMISAALVLMDSAEQASGICQLGAPAHPGLHP